MKNVLVADNHEVRLKGIKAILEENFETAEVSGVLCFKAAVEQTSLRPWDLVILGAELPDDDFVETVCQIRAANKVAPIIIFSSFIKAGATVKVMGSGANGFIPKRSRVNELLDAIQKVLTGHTYVHSEVAAELATHLNEKKTLVHEKLSARELEVFLMIANGRTVKEIAQLLRLSEKTVACHLARAREKTGLTSHVQITRYAFRFGLVS